MELTEFVVKLEKYQLPSIVFYFMEYDLLDDAKTLFFNLAEQEYEAELHDHDRAGQPYLMVYVDESKLKSFDEFLHHLKFFREHVSKEIHKVELVAGRFKVLPD